MTDEDKEIGSSNLCEVKEDEKLSRFCASIDLEQGRETNELREPQQNKSECTYPDPSDSTNGAADTEVSTFSSSVVVGAIHSLRPRLGEREIKRHEEEGSNDAISSNPNDHTRKQPGELKFERFSGKSPAFNMVEQGFCLCNSPTQNGGHGLEEQTSKRLDEQPASYYSPNPSLGGRHREGGTGKTNLVSFDSPTSVTTGLGYTAPVLANGVKRSTGIDIPDMMESPMANVIFEQSSLTSTEEAPNEEAEPSEEALVEILPKCNEICNKELHKSDHTRSTCEHSKEFSPVSQEAGSLDVPLFKPCEVHRNNSPIFVTHAVVGAARNLHASEEVHPEERSPVAPKKHANTVLKLVAIFGCIGVVIIAALILLFHFIHERNEEEQEVKGVKSLRDSIPIEDYVLTLLPDFTVKSIDLHGNISSSPQKRAYEWLLNDPFLNDYPDWRIIQRFALGTFFYATGGNESWKDTADWMSYNAHENDWHWNLSLGSYNYDWLPIDPAEFLRDTFDDEEFRHLWLYDNALKGAIPPEMYLLTSLQTIDLGSNTLTGTIDPLVGNLQQLQVASFNYNDISGLLPSEVGLLTSLLLLTAGSTHLSGNLPTELGMLDLWALFLFDSYISGPIPSELGMLTNMLALILDENLLSSSVPTELGQLTAMQLLELGSNNLKGQIPSQLGLVDAIPDATYYRDRLAEEVIPFLDVVPNSVELIESIFLTDGWHYLDFSNNRRLSGSIPVELYQLTGLEMLYLENCELSGTIATEIGLMTSLVSWNSSFNQLTGSIPGEVERLVSDGTLASFDIMNNKLEGTMPIGLCELSVLGFDCSVRLCGCDCVCTQR